MLFLCSVLLGPSTVLGPSALFAGGTPATGTVSDELIMITGSASKTEDGDYGSANDGLDTFHSYRIEVPEGASRLVLELYDMDLLFGIDDGTNNEQALERDRIRDYQSYLDNPISNDSSRVFYTIATYELYDPSGARVITTGFQGSHFAPENADGAWLVFYDSNTADTSAGDTFRDQFDTVSYSNNDGTQSFSTDWIESQDTGTGGVAGPSAGLLRVVDSTPVAGEIANQLRISDQGDFSPDTGREPGIERELDLSAYTSATLSFDFTTASQIEKPDSLVVELSSDGGATYTVIDDFSGYEVSFSGTREYDITPFISSETRVRFRVENLYAGSNEALHIDDFEIRATSAAASAPTPGHWQLRVDVSSAVAQDLPNFNGDETNAFGLRAHDGDASAAGTEFHVYTHHYTAGINPNDSGRDYTLYPYITSGCEFDVNDFDWDANLSSNVGAMPPLDPPFGSLEITSPDGSYTNASTLSDNDAWSSNTAAGWTDEDSALLYGTWTMPFRVEDPIDGNYAPIVVGTGENTGPPPTAIPEPESFRIYLPTDGGGRPPKGYLYQGMTTFATEPNPPADGESALYTVTVGVVNPDGATGDLDFDAVSNVVTARVPAGPTYQGVVVLDQGIIVSQPVVGTTIGGDIVWNPGSVAAGSGSDTRARMAYQLEVDGQPAPYSIDVTAAPGSGNGTRASWLDETNTAYATGELCNMRIVSAAATPVVVASFDAVLAPGDRGPRARLRWSTASEAATLGFQVLREGPDGTLEPVWRQPLTALLGRAGGGTYLLDEPTLAPGARGRYWLVEHSARGRELFHGPFDVRVPEHYEPDDPSTAAASTAAFDRQARPIADAYLDRLLATRTAQAERQTARAVLGTRGEPAERVKILVDHTGIQRLPAARLAESFGVSVAEASGWLRQRGLRLSVGGDGSVGSGDDVAWLASGRGGALEFFGQALDTPHTRTRVYWLERGEGLAMRRARAAEPAPDWGAETFFETLWIEENTRPVTVADLDPTGDIWFWDFVRHDTAQAERDFAMRVPAPSLSTAGSVDFARPVLRLHLQGASVGAHRLEASWNGAPLGEVAVVDDEFTVAELTLDPGALADGQNVLRLRAVAGDLVFVEGFELTYDRRSEADGDRLLMTSRPGPVTTASGFGSGDLRVLDVGNPLRPVLVRPRKLAEANGSYRAIWAQDGSRTYALAAGSGLHEPMLLADRGSDWASTAHAADLVLIAPPTLVEAARELAAHPAVHRHGELEVVVVELEDVYDEFAAGVVDPFAIRRFLRHAHREWSRGPSMAWLVGHGTYDYRDHWGLGDNLLPPLLWSRGDSLFPTDGPYGDFDADGVPEVVVGRLPALEPREVSSYLSKLESYAAAGEEPAEPWAHRFLLLADFADGSGDFTATSQQLESLLPVGIEARTVYLDQAPSVDAARQSLFDELAAGAAWMHWSGHGGIDRLSSSQLLTSADLPALAAGDRLPVLTAVSCNIGLHALPGIDGLAEQLVLAEGKGVVAAFAPAWLSEHAESDRLADRLFRETFATPSAGESRVLAEAVRQALASAAALGLDLHALYGYQLLGNPALELQIRAVPPTPTCQKNCGGRG